MLRYYNFSHNLHLKMFEELLKRFTELVILLQILEALFNQDCGTLADFDFLNTNCLLFAKYEEVGWFVQEYSFLRFRANALSKA